MVRDLSDVSLQHIELKDKNSLDLRAQDCQGIW